MSLVEMLQAVKRLWGFCPCCGEPFRLSEATVFTTDAPPRTVLDKLEAKQANLDERRTLFESEQRQKVQRQAAERGRREARRRLREIAPRFVQIGIDPEDVKVIFDPVCFVGFRGMCSGSIEAVALIAMPPSTPRQEEVYGSIARTIRKGNVEWRTLRISDHGSVVAER